MNLFRWGFRISGVISITMIFIGVIFPELFFNITYFCAITIIITILGILALYCFQFTHLKKIALIIFITSAIIVFIWYFLFEFSYVIFFSICNFCYIFVFALFLLLVPYYAIKYQTKFEGSAIKGYHIHENFYGFLFIFIGILMVFSIWWYTNIYIIDFVKYHASLYLGAAFIILGAFLVGRDLNDVKNFRFIEKLASRTIDPNFNLREKYYQLGKFGIIFTLFGIIFLFQNKLWGALFYDSSLFIGIGLALTIIGSFFQGLNPTYFAKKANIL